MAEPLHEATVLIAHLAMGLGLAACAGLRAFLPLLVVGLAGRFELVPLSGSYEWLASTPALVVFAVAVIAEITADKVPVVDHLLDAFQVVVKPMAGALVMATVVSDWAPLYLVVVWIIGGGSLAGIVHLTKAKLRLLSSVTTAGVGNPVLSVSEDAGAVAVSVGSIFLPLVVACFVLGGLIVGWITLRNLRRRPA